MLALLAKGAAVAGIVVVAAFLLYLAGRLVSKAVLKSYQEFLKERKEK